MIRGAPDRVAVVLLCVLVWTGQAGAVRIQECSNGSVTQQENRTPARFVCDGFTANDTVTWTLVNKNSSIPAVITCMPGVTVCNKTGTSLSGSGEINTVTSTLIIYNNYRMWEGTDSISCSAAKQTASCTLNVEAEARMSKCGVTLNAKDWTVSGSCRFEGAYSSTGRYTCVWHQHTDTQQPVTTIPGVVDKMAIDRFGGVEYNGNCTFMTSLSPRQVVRRYSYSVTFVPGSGDRPAYGWINIQSPEDPVTDCPQYVYEGQNVSCDCLVNQSSPGLPPATAQWQGNSAGQPLVVLDITRNDSGRVFTCSLLWGPANDTISIDTHYTLDVAYLPPLPPVISGYNLRSGMTAENLTLTCTVTGGRPLVTSVNFSCGPDVEGDVSSQNVTNTSVSVTFTIHSVEARHDGTECVCTGDWEVYREAYNVSATIQLRVMETFVFPLRVVAGVAGGSVVVIILVAVVVVVVRRCRPIAKPHEHEDTEVIDTAGTDDENLEHFAMPTDTDEDGGGYATVTEATSHRASSSDYGYAVPEMQPSGTSDRDGKTSAVMVEERCNLYAEPDVPLSTQLTKASDRNRKASTFTVEKGGNLYAEPDVPLSTHPSEAQVKDSRTPTVTLREDGSLYSVMDIVSRVPVASPSFALETPDDPATHTYSQVDKSAKRSKSTTLDVYAQVNKATKRNTSAATEVSKGVGALEQTPEEIVKPKPTLKPRISVKPKLNK